MRVRRGYAGNEPRSLTFTAPVASGVTIYSGQVISLDNTGSWILGAPAGKTPYIAYHDSTDTDVKSAGGRLLGFSCSGKFTIETAYFTSGAGAFNANDLALKADTAGNVGNVTLASSVKDTADIIGFTSNGGLQNVATTNSESQPAGGPPATVGTLVFDTNWLPARS
jgi:hypothetical protein